jgi:uncharacterized protein
VDPTVLWILAIALIVVGIVGTIVPALPGAVAIFGGMFLAAWIDSFAKISVGTVVLLGALVGATLGAIIGLFFGLPGLLLGPFVGAVIGEFLTRQKLDQAARVGFGTWIGLLVGALAKLALAFTMLGVFAAAYFIP